MKDDSIYNLHKVPDDIIIKELRVEIGILKSERDELRDLLPIEKKINTKEKYVMNLENRINNLLNKNKKLESEGKVAILTRMSSMMSKQLNRARADILTKNKQIDLLQKELLKIKCYEEKIDSISN